MSRKTTFIIILVVICLLLGGLLGFYFYQKNKNVAPTILGKSTSGKTFGGYNPDAKNQGTTNDNGLIIPAKKTENGNLPRLRKISSAPVAGSNFVSLAVYASSSRNIEPEDTSLTGGKVVSKTTPKLLGYRDVIRFMERATGHIYETGTTTNQNVRISNTTITKVYEAFFTERGDSVIMRDLVGNTDTIRTRYGVLALATTTDSEKSLVTVDLPTGISNMAQSPTRDQVVSILKEGTTGYVSKPDGGAKQSVLDIPFREWLVDWPESKTIVLTTKPSSFYPGFAYTLSPSSKTLTRVLGGINGLTTLMSPDASKILFSSSVYGTFKLSYLTLKDNSQTIIPIRTLPEKCAWARGEKDVIYCAVPEDVAFNSYPDVWYQGNIAFSDSIWKINISTGETRLISKLAEESGEIIDVQSISIDNKDDYLLFTDKNSLALWGLRLKEIPKGLFDILAPSTTASSTR